MVTRWWRFLQHCKMSSVCFAAPSSWRSETCERAFFLWCQPLMLLLMLWLRFPLFFRPLVVKECARYALKKGTWSRLLPPGRAELRKRQLLSPEDELPGEALTCHPLWSLLARGLHYEEQWRAEVYGSPHINLLELKAFLKEERRLCGLHQQKRCLAALDSQVCLGALVKGRSSSPGINRALKSALAYPLGASFHNYFMYYLSEENRADGPTRKRPPDPPYAELPAWFRRLLEGDHHGFDQWIRGLGPDFSLHPFNFEELMNGEKADLRPHSHGRERKTENFMQEAQHGSEVDDLLPQLGSSMLLRKRPAPCRPRVLQLPGTWRPPLPRKCLRPWKKAMCCRPQLLHPPRAAKNQSLSSMSCWKHFPCLSSSSKATNRTSPFLVDWTFSVDAEVLPGRW